MPKLVVELHSLLASCWRTVMRFRNRTFWHVTSATSVFQKNETAAMLVFQTNPVGVELFSYVNVFFCSRNLRRRWPCEWNSLYVWATIDLTRDIRHFCTRFRVDGIKAISLGFSGAKQIIKLANTSKHGWICLFSQNKTATLVLQMCKLSLVKFLSHY